MIKKQEVYSAAFALKKEALDRKKAEYELAKGKLYQASPQLSEIDMRLTGLSRRLALAAIAGDKNEFSLLQQEMTELSEQKKDIIEKADIKPIEYDCPHCRDTGYTDDGHICECIKSLTTAIACEWLSKEMPLNECSFESFNLNFYPTADDARKKMTAILKLCREYAIAFSPQTSPNLLFMGETGLGKTHLTLAIVSEVLKKGYDCIYGSAFNLLTAVEKEHFGQGGDSYEALLSCDLLVIDDLGTEFVSPFTVTTLYGIINTRILSKKPTIINTNLTMADIKKKYTDRIASRLIGCYEARKFVGNDIRQIKKISVTGLEPITPTKQNF